MDKSTEYLPLVSVITVCFNARQYLERAMCSVLAQNYPKVEYIIIDGGSTDGTLEIVGKYKERISFLVSEPDSGIYDAQNKGIRISTGEIICILNSDDQFYSSVSIAKAVDYLQDHNADLVYGNMLNTNLDGTQMHLVRFPKVLKKRFFLRGPLGHPSTFYKRSCFDKVGLYDLHYKISADYDWILRALYGKGLKAGHLNEILSIFQEGGRSQEELVCGKETNCVIKTYFTPREVMFGRFQNFFLYGDICRLLAKLVFLNRGYGFLRSRMRKLTATQYKVNQNKERIPI